MSSSFSLLQIIGKNLAKYAINTAAFGLPVGDILVAVGEKAMEAWKDQSREEQRQAELEALAHATGQEVARQVGEIIRTDFGSLPKETQEAVRTYLTQVTSNYRRKCTRLGGPGGVAVVTPVAINDARELRSFLPEIPPDFKPSPRSRLMRPEEIDKLLNCNHSINGGIIRGLDGYVVEVQARAKRGLSEPRPWSSAVRIVGNANRAINEAKDRLSGAFAKLSIPDPQVEILVNLVPADLRKQGTWLDLPLAVVLCQAAGILPEVPEHEQGNFVLFGEVDIHANVLRVPGALPIAFCTKPGQDLIVPAGNEKECALILADRGHRGCRIFGVSTLEEVIKFFQGKRELQPALRAVVRPSAFPEALDFGVIRGQAHATGAACVAAAGGHNLLLIGPPGCGKNLVASALPGILPPLTHEETVHLTKLYSAFDALEKDGVAVSRRPFREVHSSTPQPALIGGGSGFPKPGEITFAHLGVLFLDELPQFSRATLDALRQPMEDGKVRISRARGSLTFPCRFTLVAAMNPCECGYYGTPRCSCREKDVKDYQQRISEPILDRIDLQVQMNPVSVQAQFEAPQQDLSRKLRDKVQAAREIQHRRFAGTNIPFNAAIPAGRVPEFCHFTAEGWEFYIQTLEQNVLSPRSRERIAKVARTVADMAGAEHVAPAHVTEAGKYVIGGLLRG